MGGICSTRGKSEVVRVHAMKAQRGNGGIAPFILNIATSTDVGGQRHTPAALPPGKTRHPLNRNLGGPQSRSGRF